MKPVMLKISGLQSYKELQTIDFSALCEGGVFGIFGPTGSGKSTILDAMTLALYGKVERASGGTQGIMNQSEDKLYVSFTFELAEPGGRATYQVERQFKRTNEISIATSACRLTRMAADREQVLADKGTDVGQRIEELLGLNMQDFTRAVVLPQGKFAEFLSLKGSDRRQMLQRLFNLEQYGDQLQIKLSQKAKQTDNELKQLLAKLEGLGEASKEAVEEARAKWKEAEQKRQEALQRQLSIEASFEKMKTIRSYQLEREQYSKQLEQLSQQEEAIAVLEHKAARAEAASKLKPYWIRWKETEKRADEAELAKQGAKQNKRRMDEAFALAQKQAAEIQQVRSAEEPKLLEEIQRYKQGVELQRELMEHAKEQQRLSDSYEQQAQQLRAQQQELAQLQDLLQRAEQKQDRLKQEYKSLETDVQQRRQVRDAFKDKLSLQALEQMLQSAAAEHDKMREKLDAAERAEAEAVLSLNMQSGQVSQQMLQLIEGIEQLHAARQQLEGFIAQGPAWLKQLEKVRMEREREQLAAELAAHLEEGSPCPVCGATHHPARAELVALTGEEEHSAELYSLQEALEQCRGWLTDNKSYEREAGLLLTDMRNRLSDSSHEPREYLLEAVLEAAPAQDNVLVQIPIETGTPNWKERYLLIERSVQQYRDRFQSLMEYSRNTLQSYMEAARQAREKKLLKDTLIESERESREKKQNAAAQREKAVSDWQGKYKPLSFEEIDGLHAAMEEKEQQYEDLRKRLDTSIEFLETKWRSLQQLQDTMTNTEKQCLEASTRLEGIRQLISEKSKRLQEGCGSLEPHKALLEAEDRYQQLKQKEQELLRALDVAREAVSKADNSFSRAEEAFNRLREEKERAEQEWHQALDSSPFSEEAPYAAALAEPEVIKQWLDEIKRYRETYKELQMKISQLDERLGEDRISEEQWQQVTEQLQSIKAEAELLLAIQAKAERDVEELTAKHTLWLQLKKEADDTKHLHDQYTHLQTVLRGNAFVEYIAEEQMMQVSRSASERLGQLTRQRYAIEVDSSGGFIIRDQHNGGLKRPVSTLSGGETFLTSLALALALSSQIQLRGQYPLEFFFLDEGFGTLDPDLLETVVNALEKLRNDRVSVGVISHVPELRARLPRKLIVTPANDTGRGSRIHLEMM